MAKQLGPYYVTGYVDNILFYKMEGKYYARKKSSLTGKKVKTHPCFALTRLNYSLFSIASTIGSRVYKMLPVSEREHEMYKKMTGEAMKLLKQGIQEMEVQELLVKTWVEKASVLKPKTAKITGSVKKKPLHKRLTKRHVRLLKKLHLESHSSYEITGQDNRRRNKWLDKLYFGSTTGQSTITNTVSNINSLYSQQTSPWLPLHITHHRKRA